MDELNEGIAVDETAGSGALGGDPGTMEVDDARLESAQAVDDEGVSSSEPLSYDELREKYAHLQRGFTQATQDRGALEREVASLREQQAQITAGLQDPAMLRLMHEKLTGTSLGSPAAPDPQSPESIAEDLGLDADLTDKLVQLFDRAGFVRGNDPRLTEAEQKLQRFDTHFATQAENSVLQKYGEAAKQYATQARELQQRSNGAVDFEQALHAVSGGKLALAAAETERRAEVSRKRSAQLANPPSRPAPTPPPRRERGQRISQADAMAAFREAQKELGMSVGSPQAPTRY